MPATPNSIHGEYVGDTPVEGGNYSPGTALVSNLDSAGPFHGDFIRIGIRIIASAMLSYDPTTPGSPCVARIVAPVASSYLVDGVLVGEGVTSNREPVSLEGDTATGDIVVKWTPAGAGDLHFTIMYLLQ